MAQSVIHLTQSQFYSPVFNAAVFDGPIRIYFAQHQESLALKVYFQLQQYLKDTYAALRQAFKQQGQTVFLMLYPTSESFVSAFPEAASGADIVSERLGEDFVVGVCGPLTDEKYEQVFQKVQAILQSPPVKPMEMALL